MGTVPWTVYAPTRQKEHWTLPAGLDWKAVQLKVRRLQERIAKAVKLKKYRRVRSLQWLLTHSFHAKLLAVKRVTSNKGKTTPGVDGVVLKTAHQKMDTVKHLQRHGYKASPLRRVYIPKKSGDSTGGTPTRGECGSRRTTFGPHQTIRWSFFAVKKHPDGRKEYRDLIKAVQ